METMGMNAGRELDVLVAEKVMGWKRQTQERHPQGWRDGRDFHYLSARPWSRDIAAAWEVVKKLEDACYWVTITTGGNPGQGSAVALQKYEGDDANIVGPKILGIGWDTPEAICIAALQAVGAIPIESNEWVEVSPGMHEMRRLVDTSLMKNSE